MRLFNIETGNSKADGGTMFGVVPKAIWQRKYAVDEKNLCNIANRCLIVDTGDRIVLIDTGIGDKQDEKYLSFHHLYGDDTLTKSIHNAGYKEEDITDIILTHLHWDHCGGAAYKDSNGSIKMRFTKANIWVSKDQWDWAVNPNIREAPAYLEENILPLEASGKLILVEKESEIIPGIEIKILQGHTKGFMVPIIHKDDQKVLFAGDLIPTMANIPLVYVASFDIMPLETIKEKERLLKQAVEENWIIVFQHDLYNEACTVKETPKGIRENKLLKISEI
jgi:glyoxylase-like metal-dependent hydrolase (beta-lactamase superfamily II)